MLTSLLAMAALAPKTWYGPATATFSVEFGGNPYDPEQNDVRVRFLGDKGEPIERIAYYDGNGAYKAVLVAERPGRYMATMIRNGKPSTQPANEGVIEIKNPLPRGFIRPDTVNRNRFRWDNQEVYYPVGFNLGWQNGDLPPIPKQIEKMAANGVNWTRIWSSSWDGKNPWWPQEDPEAIADELWAPALGKWEAVIRACDAYGVPFQMVLFNHGSFSSRVNPNWPDHPWNAAKGGFLKDAADFFTDKEAKRRTKMWLRYAVARYAASPSLMAWELFNEVEWVDARYANRWGDIAAWHKEMAAYIRELDPYDHMVTTSSHMEEKEMWATMDYYQPHTYPPDVLSAIGGASLPQDKPGFFGEFGPPNLEAPDLRQRIRDGIYGGMLANQAGAGMFWFWDHVEKKDLYGEFKNAAKVLQLSGLANRPNARPTAVRVTTPGRADLSFGPGLGWGKTTNGTLSVPSGLSPGVLAGLSGYLQSSTGNNSAMAAPMVFQVDAPQAGTLTVKIGQSSKGGAKLNALVNGKSVSARDFPAAEKDADINVEFKVPFPAGRSEVRLENTGADWVRIDRFTFSGLAPQASAMALTEADWAVVRLTVASGAPTPLKLDLGALGLTDGTFSAVLMDLEKGGSASSALEIKNGTVRDLSLTSADSVLILKKG